MDTLLHTGDYGTFEGARADLTVFGYYRKHNEWSGHILNVIQTELGTTGGTFIDVGANIGLVSIPIAQRSAAHVFAFEPEPHNFRLLQRNVARHALEERITLFECAAYDRQAHVAMRLSLDNFGDHQVVQTQEEGQVRVSANTLDALLDVQMLQKPVVVKIDTQGCEVRVLRGAQQTLSHVDVLLLEYWPLGVQRLGDSLADFIPLLSHFPQAQVVSQKEPSPPPSRSEDLLAGLARLLAPGDPGFFDLLLRRAS